MNSSPLAPYLAFVRRHRWSYLAALLVAVLSTVIYLAVTPVRYRAAATTIVPYREQDSDLRFNNGRNFPVQYPFVVNNHLEVLRSGTVRQKLLQIIRRDDPGLMEELQREVGEGEGELGLLRALEGRLRASARDRTGVLRIEASAATAEHAAQLANLALLSFADVQDSLNHVSAYEWLAQLQSEETLWVGQLAEREDRLQNFRSEAAVMDLMDQSRAVVREIISLRVDASRADAELRSQKAKMAERERQLAGVFAGFQEELKQDPSGVVRALRDQLARDVAALDYMRSTGAPPSASQVQSLEERIARTRELLDTEGQQLAQDPWLKGDPTELASNLLLAIEGFESDISGRRAELDRLWAEADSLQRRMVELPALAAVEDRLEREARLAQEVYELVHERRVEAEMRTLAQDTRLPVVHAAEPPRDPSSPRTLLAMASALLITLLVGSGAAVVVEGLDPTLRDADEAGRLAGLPILSRPGADGGEVTPALATLAAARRAAQDGRALWLLDVESGGVEDLVAMAAGIRGGDLRALLGQASPPVPLVVLVARAQRTRRGSFRQTARLLEGTGYATGGVILR